MVNHMIEKEYKFILSNEEYNTLLNRFNWENTWVQKNTYFDTPDLLLSQQDITLRVRETPTQIAVDTKIKKRSTNENQNLVSKLQLKEVIKNYSDAIMYIQTGMPSLYELAKITGLQLVSQGFMRTDRFEIQTNSYKIHLDNNFYLDQRDFELEIELIQDTQLPKELQHLITNLSLRDIDAVGKRSRFFGALAGRKI